MEDLSTELGIWLNMKDKIKGGDNNDYHVYEVKIFTKMENNDWETSWASGYQIFSLEHLHFGLPEIHWRVVIK